MKIKNARINNFRLLKDIILSFNDKTTVVVGRNNSGKTSLTEIFRRFFSETNSQKFKLEDFSISAIEKFRQALGRMFSRNFKRRVHVWFGIHFIDCSDYAQKNVHRHLSLFF